MAWRFTPARMGQAPYPPMKNQPVIRLTAMLAALLAVGAVAWQVNAAETRKDAIKEVMKTLHKAPKGEDPVCKKAMDGKATPEELKKLVEGYRQMALAKPPKGDLAAWKEKTAKLLTASVALQKGVADASAKYKEAVNCKACHDAHKAD